MAASSGVKLGHGTKVRIGRGSSPIVWTELNGVEDAQFPDQTPVDVDVTHLNSPNGTEETIRGLKTVATYVLPLHYVPGSDSDTLLSDLEATAEDVILEITPNGGGAHRWAAYVNTYRPSSIVAKDKQMAEATFKVKAKISAGSPSAPVNTTLPAISGVAQVGELLTAWPGIWSPAGDFTFQWQVNDSGWANISGATAQTFTPTSAQEDKTLRVIVTATNSTGSTSATSTATAAVQAE